MLALQQPNTLPGKFFVLSAQQGAAKSAQSNALDAGAFYSSTAGGIENALLALIYKP